MKRCNTGRESLFQGVVSFALCGLACACCLVGAYPASGQDAPQEAERPAGEEDAASEEEERLQELSLADGRLVLQAPARWDKQRPSVRIIEVELTVPAKDDDAEPGRLTIMRAGGSVEANIERWYGQFVQPDGKTSEDAAKVEEKEVDGLKVHTVDLSGTFMERRGPVAPATKRENYRMLAAIIETDGAGNYFIKLTGPAETIEQSEEAFARMVDEFEWRE